MDLEDARFLDRVKEGDDGKEQQEDKREQRLFIVRNTLNCLFILLALAAMCGIGYYWYSGNTDIRLYSFGIGITAVLLKMVEATLRMTSMIRKPNSLNTHRRKRSL